MDDLKQLFSNDLNESLLVHKNLIENQEIFECYTSIVTTCVDALKNNDPIFFAGNGGSFADAQHLAAEFTGKMGRMRNSLPAIALGTNNSSMSAIGNDFGYDFVFSREFEALRKSKSVVIALSTSGNSQNIIELVRSAKKFDNPIFAITGQGGGKIAQLCSTIRIPSDRTERIQEIEILIGHSICFAVEEMLGIFDK